MKQSRALSREGHAGVRAARPAGTVTHDIAPRLRGAVALAVALALAMPSAPLLAQTPGARGAAPAEDTATLNFVNADLEATVRAIGQYTGRQFVIDPRVKGTLNLVTERPVTKQQAYEQLLSALRLQGFTIVEGPGGIARVLPEADAKLQGGPVVTPQERPARGDQIVTEVIEIYYESATNLVPVLRPLIAPNNTISAYPSNNTLVITDYADNLRRLREIIRAIDRPGAAAAETVPLKHGLALDIATVVNRVLDEGARAAGQATDGGQRIQVLAVPSSNSLIIRATSRARVDQAKQLIERLDQPSATPGNIHVVYLRNAQAVRLAQTLRAVISADPSFMPQTGGTGGLSPGGSAFGGQQGQQPGQPQLQPQAQQPQQLGGAGGAGGSGPLAGMIQADAATNSLIISAPEPLYRNIRAIIDRLDVRQAQVVIESLIVEVTADKAAEFGVQWQSLGGFREGSSGTSVIGGTNFGGAGTNIIGAATNITSVGTGLNIGVIRGSVTIAGQQITNLGFLARALETTANANILSQPNIQTLDNEEAKFLVGQNVPFVTGSFSSTGAGQGNAGAINPFQTFERRDVGLQLRVKPQISEGGNVRMAIYLEVSSVQPGTAAGGLITNKRSFESVVNVEDGNFVVLSGLIEDRTNNSESRVPLLGSLPVIGGLFRYENRDRRKTNTMVFLRPKVVRDEATSSALAADRYEYMRTQTSQAQKPDNWVLRGYQGNQLPPFPAVVPNAPPPPPSNAVPPPIQRDSRTPTAPGTPPAASTGDPSALPPGRGGAAPAAPMPPSGPGTGAATAPVDGAGPMQPGSPSAPATAAADPAASTGNTQLIEVLTTPNVARGRDVQRQLRAAGFDAYWESVRAPGQPQEQVRVRVAVDRATQNPQVVVTELRKRGFAPTLVTP